MKKIFKELIKTVCYYFVSTGFAVLVWFLLFGRNDDGKKKLENGKEAVNA